MTSKSFIPDQWTCGILKNLSSKIKFLGFQTSSSSQCCCFLFDIVGNTKISPKQALIPILNLNFSGSYQKRQAFLWLFNNLRVA